MKLGTLAYVSNKADFVELYEVIDEESGTPITLTTVDAIVLQIRDPNSRRLMLTASLANGKIALADTDSKFQVSFTAAEMGGLSAKTYELGATLTEDAEVKQLVIGYLPVLDGIIS